MKIFLAGGETRHWIPMTLVRLGGGEQGLNETVFGKPSYINEIQMGERYTDISCKYSEDSRRGYIENPSGISERREKRKFQTGVAPLRGGEGYDPIIREFKPFILESFYYCDADTERLLPYFGDFLLDSGAFTFMQGNHNDVIDWEEYIERYADFINKNNIKKFFELDIDSVVGYSKVLEYRRKLERLTNKPCIPVWHKSRGIEEYYRHCEEYPYVAIGGYVIRELKPNDFKAFPHMIRYAHKNNSKVHCLGFTKLSDLPKYHFDSVDSTAWTTGNRFGYIYRFTGKTMVKINTPSGKRLADSRQVALINYMEWIKFQRYALTHL